MRTIDNIDWTDERVVIDIARERAVKHKTALRVVKYPGHSRYRIEHFRQRPPGPGTRVIQIQPIHEHPENN